VALPYDPETVVLGVVGRPHGVNGEVWLRPHNVLGTPFETLRALVLERDGVRTPYGIEYVRPTPDGAIVKFAGVNGREAASALTLSEVRVPRSALPALAPGEYYVGDVIGCAVAHADGRALGVVTSTFWNGAHDLIIVKTPGDAASEELIPLVPQFVVNVDIAGRKLVVSWDGHD
jgi:16S rRNA processing protein RimM